MTRRLITLYFPILFFQHAQTLFAQNVTEFTVFFNSGKSDLNNSEKIKIDSVLKTITDKNLTYDITAIGHTDNTGTEKINKNLSYNRAKTISAYVKKNLRTNDIQVIGKSSTDPVSRDTSASARAKNRRVQIVISVPVPKIKNIGQIRLNTTEYTIDTDKDDTLTYSSGTKIIVPKGIFVDENENKIVGKITLNYVEYRDPIDFILAGVHMNYSEKGENSIFNSSGMFNMSANQNSKSVYIKKGEKIDVNFAPTQPLPQGTNYYNYDTTRSKWSTISALTTKNSDPVFNHKNEIVKNICSKDECDGIKMILDLGGSLSDNEVPIYSNIVYKYHLDIPEIRRLDINVKEIDKKVLNEESNVTALEKEVYQKPVFKIENVTTIENNISFKISGDTSRKNNFSDLENVSWQCNSNMSNRKYLNLLAEKHIVGCKIIKLNKKGKGSLIFTIDKQEPKITIEAIMIVDNMNTKTARKNLYKDYRDRTRTVKKFIRQQSQYLSTERIILDKEKALQTGTRDSLGRLLSNIKSDSIYCFWDNSKRYMSVEEKDMIMIFWYEYFQKNNKKFKAMYSGMKKTNAIVDTCNAVTKRRDDAALKAKKDAKIFADASSLMVSLSVNSFGVYNCDQLAKLKSPKTIAANYTNQEGKNVKLISTYLIDGSINSVMIFNGYAGLSPTKFAYSPYSKNTLMCFDENGDAWICSAKEFNKAVDTDSDSKTFIIKKVYDVKNKAELQSNF